MWKLEGNIHYIIYQLLSYYCKKSLGHNDMVMPKMNVLQLQANDWFIIFEQWMADYRILSFIWLRTLYMEY